jgi:hypothetical protein
MIFYRWKKLQLSGMPGSNLDIARAKPALNLAFWNPSIEKAVSSL